MKNSLSKPEKQSIILDALAIQIFGGNQKCCIFVYNLKNRNLWQTVDLPKSSLTSMDWEIIFGMLSQRFPPNIVKSIFICMHFCQSLEKIRPIALKFGYTNLNWSTNLMLIFTSELLMAKKNGKKYKIGDYIVIGRYSGKILNHGEIHLLRKQEIGWDIVDSKLVQHNNLNSHNLEEFLGKNAITLDDIKDVFFRSQQNNGSIQNFLKNIYPPKKLFVDLFVKEYLKISGEYLAKVYSGEEYFNDYDCFVGNVIMEKYELVYEQFNIVLSFQFKRLPFILKEKIKLPKCSEMKVSFDNRKLILILYQVVKFYLSDFSRLPLTKTLFALNVKTDGKVAVVTIGFDEDKVLYFKIEKEDAEKTLITSNFPSNEWKDYRPTFILGKDYCSANYYKDGLLWKLKDANGNDKIPFKISFDKEIHVGNSALEHSEFLMPEIDLEMLLNEKTYSKLSKKHESFILDTDSKYKVQLKTYDGIQKTLPENLLAIFLKPLFKLLEQELEKSVEEIYLELSYPLNVFPANSMIMNVNFWKTILRKIQ